MTKLQYAVLASATILFVILYFVFDTKPPRQALVEKSRALQAQDINIDALSNQALDDLDAQAKAKISGLSQALDTVLTEEGKIPLLKELSGAWYAVGQPALAGNFAEQVATLENTAESWGIAVTTFSLCIQRSTDEKLRSYCTKQAVTAYENAISLAPNDVNQRVNLALTYTANPPEDNPMKGILLLRELNSQYPENVTVINNLARLAIQTGQFDRAIQRLEQAISLEADNLNSVCLLAQAYEGKGDQANAETFAQKCQELRN